MVQVQLINSVIGAEKKLEYEEEKRKKLHFDPYTNYLAAPRSAQKVKTKNQASGPLINLVDALSMTARNSEQEKGHL